jgi:hypothetical protein
VKAELLDEATASLLDTVVLVRCDGRGRLRHPSPSRRRRRRYWQIFPEDLR